MCVSNSKKVQEAGMSALATFEGFSLCCLCMYSLYSTFVFCLDVACFDLIAYLEQICHTLVQCLTNYQQKNRFICYDAIAYTFVFCFFVKI
jgi:hypothetical protein